MIKLFQNRSWINKIDLINSLSYEQAFVQVPEFKAHHECSFRGSKSFTPDMFKYFTHVATIDTDNFETAFEACNGGSNENIVTRITNMSSMSVGNIIQTEDDKFFMCDSVGFTEITVK